MHFSHTLLFLASALPMLAQTTGESKTIPLDLPGVKLPPGAPQPSVTLQYESPAGPWLTNLPPDKVVLTLGAEKITAAQLNPMI